MLSFAYWRLTLKKFCIFVFVKNTMTLSHSTCCSTFLTIACCDRKLKICQDLKRRAWVQICLKALHSNLSQVDENNVYYLTCISYITYCIIMYCIIVLTVLINISYALFQLCFWMANLSISLSVYLCVSWDWVSWRLGWALDMPIPTVPFHFHFALCQVKKGANIRALWHSALSVRVPGCQKSQMTA